VLLYYYHTSCRLVGTVYYAYVRNSCFATEITDIIVSTLLLSTYHLGPCYIPISTTVVIAITGLLSKRNVPLFLYVHLSVGLVNPLRPHFIILASCKPGFRLAWACRKHVASRSKACRKQVESQLQTCLKPSDDRTMQQVRDQVFDKKSRKHVANPHELVENLTANLVE